MATGVESFVGHLLSRCTETVTEGLQKMCTRAVSDGAFATAFLLHSQGFATLQEIVQKRELSSLALQTMTQLLDSCDNKGVRSSAMREICRGKSFWVLRRGLSSLSDVMLPVTMATLQFLAIVALHMPKLVLSQFDNTVPLHLACFRLQLPYSQRRVRMARMRLLINLALSYQTNTVETVVCAHGYLTQLMEDAAELLQEGSEVGVELANTALKIFSERFMSWHIPQSQKRSILLAQKNVIRLLARALEHPLVSDYSANIISRIAVELVESPCDYQVMRLETEERGMPNYLLFFILRHLRPKRSQAATRLVVFILHHAPDLIRPYFTRVSGHLKDTGDTTRISFFTEAVATLNLMTRAMLAPIPYHLAAGKARLEIVEAKATTFFVMSPENVAEEVCPIWIAEYVHRLIIESTDVLMLLFAMQLTQAILTRAKTVQRLVAKLQNFSSTQETCERNFEEWEAFNTRVKAALLKAVPRWEEFWHRMTQQIHTMLSSLPSNIGGKEQQSLEKGLFIAQRMFLLMESYVEVFNFRMPWLSAVPSFLPTFRACVRPIEDALFRGEGVLTTWSATSVSLLCSLFVSSLSRGVSMTKLHHITMSSTKKGVSEWPILLSLLLWAVKQREKRDEDTQLALVWVARLIQWTVHSVTVRFVCELEEAFLWVMEIDESTIPCFVHLMNHLLQRSLSKSADRIAQESLEGEFGIIVSASRVFISKNEEKFATSHNNNSCVGDDESAKTVTTLDRNNGTNITVNKEWRRNSDKKMHKISNNNNDYNNNNNNSNRKNEKGGGKECNNSEKGNDLWTTDLREHLALFKTVTERVVCGWSNRFQRMRETFPSVFKKAHKSNYGKRRIALTMLQTEKEHRALRPLHDQIFEFCTTLRPPAPAADTEEEMSLLVVVRGGSLDEVRKCIGRGRKRNNEGNSDHHEDKQSSNEDTCRPSVWCKYPTLCWELAGLFLRRLNELREGLTCDGFESHVELCSALFGCCRDLLRSVSNDADAVMRVLLERDMIEGNTAGFFVFLLAAMHVMLYGISQYEEFKSTTRLTLKKETFTALSLLILRTYSGTLLITDRIRYATLLTISYMQQEQNKLDYQEEQMAELQNKKTIKRYAAEKEQEKKQANDNEHCEELLESQKQSTVRIFSGVLVPEAIMKERFIIMNHQSVPNLSTEVNMLSLLVDTWTNDEVETTALQCPARLNNTLLINTRGGGAGWDILRSLFPEFFIQDDIALSSFDPQIAINITDPRYLLPLIHAVLSMPAEQLPRKNIGTKCIPILLRSLSFTDPDLRRLGATALSAVWTPSGPTRIVVGFARLKLTQLAVKKSGRLSTQKEQRRGDEEESAWSCPRLPAPISAFLVMVMRSLADADYPLHNDIMRFLLKTQEAFSNPVPLHHFLTSFPLACITTPLMIQRQEAMRCKTASQVAIASANEAVRELQANEPLQLQFIIRLVQFGCQTNGDMMALIRSECLQAVMTLISMIAASSEIRLQLLRCLHCVCTTSSAVARQAIEDGHVLSWLFGFAHQLIREYSDCVYRYGEPLFMEVILLLRKLVPLAVAFPLYAPQAQQQMELMRSALIAMKVTTKNVLDGIEAILQEVEKKTSQSSTMFLPRKRQSFFDDRRPVVRMRR